MAIAGISPKRRILWSLLATLAGAAAAGVQFGRSSAAEPIGAFEPARAGTSEQKRWETVAPGRVESSSREIKISSAILAPIAEVLVHINDAVSAGDLLIRLDDDEALARLALAEAQVEDRRRARDDAAQPAAEQVKAADRVAASERAVAAARAVLDRILAARRADAASEADLANARSALLDAQERLKQARERLHQLHAAQNAPLASRTETALAVARAEWTIAQKALERTRIRAPIAGTILQVQAKVGEMASPSSELAILGDRSSLRVRAELNEHDVGKVTIGQRAVVRADAFRGRDFEGRVSAIAPIVAPGRIGSRGAQALRDTEVVEVLVDLTDASLLVVGLRVDVFFTPEKSDK